MEESGEVEERETWNWNWNWECCGWSVQWALILQRETKEGETALLVADGANGEQVTSQHGIEWRNRAGAVGSRLREDPRG
ncbi:hypothetical protein V6N13_121402 [Hibiscus sabdariffa]